jgi:hypothetical protein
MATFDIFCLLYLLPKVSSRSNPQHSSSIDYPLWNLFHEIKAPPLAALNRLDAVTVGTTHFAFSDFDSDFGPWYIFSK